MRFLGALFVLWGHTFVLCYGPGGSEGFPSDWLRQVTAYRAGLPGIGVAMFFVLSGYLVSKSYMGRDRLLVYAEARILRIYPALWANLLLVALVLGPAVSDLQWREYFATDGTWRYLLYNARLFPDIYYRLPGVFLDNPRTGVNGSLWTLPVEVRMYLIVAALGVTRVLAHRQVFNLVAAVLVIFYAVAPQEFFLLDQTRHERLALYFLLGAIMYVNRQQIPVATPGLITVTVPLGLLYFFGIRGMLFNLIFAIWFCYLVLYIAFHPRLRLPDLGRHGDFSYGLYLYAFPVTQCCILWLGADNPWLLLAPVFVVTLLLAIASWFLVERPALTLKGRLLRRAR